MTLIEVAAGLAILGTLMASLLVARSRYLRQWAMAGREQEAVIAADALLSAWWNQIETLPRQGSGELPARRMRWETHLVDNPAARDLNVQVMRLDIFEQQADSDAPPAPAQSASPLASVEIVLNIPVAGEGP